MNIRTAKIELTLTIEGLACGIIEAGKFTRFSDAWEAMVDLNCGNSNLRLKDERGLTRSQILDGKWLFR